VELLHAVLGTFTQHEFAAAVPSTAARLPSSVPGFTCCCSGANVVLVASKNQGVPWPCCYAAL
jgi:hypothetical protein